MAFGVTTDGFVKKALTDIISEMQAKAQQQFGADIDLNPTSPLQMFIEVIAIEHARDWEMAEALYYSAYMSYATGDNLDSVVELLGVQRLAATKATGSVDFTGSEATNIPLGSKVGTVGAINFVTDDAATISGGTATVDVTAVNPGVAGNVSGSTVTVLVDPLPGITSVTNPSAMTGGSDVETDSVLRARTADELEKLGKGTVAALEAAVRAVSGVTSVSTSEDFTKHEATMTISGVTVPDTDITNAIETTRPAGINIIAQNPTDVPIYVDIVVDADSATAPGDADTQIENAIIAYINGLGVGDDVIYTKLYEIIFDVDDDETAEWLLDVTTLEIDLDGPPIAGTANIVITSSQEASTQAPDVYVVVNLI